MIVGIAGTIGAGKGTAVSYLVEKEKFVHISARLVWTKELEARGLPVDRDHMTKLANELRAEHGAAFFVEQALSMVESKDSNVVIESIRTVGEAELLKKNGGILLAVDANRELRFERISERGSKLDNVTFEDFVRQENNEMQNEDPTKQNIVKVMELADFVIENNGTVDELFLKVEYFLEKVR